MTIFIKSDDQEILANLALLYRYVVSPVCFLSVPMSFTVQVLAVFMQNCNNKFFGPDMSLTGNNVNYELPAKSQKILRFATLLF